MRAYTLQQLVMRQLLSDKDRVERIVRAGLKDEELRGTTEAELREAAVDAVMGRVEEDEVLSEPLDEEPLC